MFFKKQIFYRCIGYVGIDKFSIQVFMYKLQVNVGTFSRKVVQNYNTVIFPEVAREVRPYESRSTRYQDLPVSSCNSAPSL